MQKVIVTLQGKDKFSDRLIQYELDVGRPLTYRTFAKFLTSSLQVHFISVKNPTLTFQHLDLPERNSSAVGAPLP